MDRQAFKQRMQNLKSYRENNPGKGYWDWKDERTDHPIKKPTLPQEPIRIQYAIRNLGGKSDESWRKYDKDNDGQLSSEERLNRQKDERRIEDWKNLGRGINNTFGTAASLASLIGGGGWSLTRLLAGNRATQLGRSLAPSVLPTNAADNVGDIIDFATEPTTSKAVEIGVGLGLGKWKDFGSTARQAAELSSQSLNATNTFTESFADGGEVGDPEKERFYQATGRSSSGRPLEEGLRPVFNLEDAANMTPIGDAISAKDAYNAVKNRDWLSAGLAAATMIPFVPMTVKSYRKKYKGITPKREIPTVNKAAEQDAINKAINYKESRIKLYEQALEDRNLEYENWIENEDALRRAVNFDKKYGTNYVSAYTKELKNYAKGKNSSDLTQIGIKPMTQDGSFDPAIPDYIFISSDQIGTAKPKSGLINHELGHKIDRQAGVIDHQGQLTIPIFDRNKFESSERLRQIYPKTHDRIQNYLLKDSEIKSHMNAFRTYLRNNNMLGPNGKETLNSFKKKLFNSDFDNLKKIFNSYKSGKQFIQDFNMIPITRVNNNNNILV